MNLLALLQSAVGAPDIEVTGKKLPIPVQAPVQEAVPEPAAPPAKRRMLSDQQLVNRQGVGNLPQHKGMFGTKGTLRDVLGAFGDHYLMSMGQKPGYRELRQREKTSDAMAEMVNSPVNAIQALLGAGAHEEAYELYKQFQTQGNKDAELEVSRSNAAATSGTAKSNKIDKFVTRFGQMLNGADTPEKRAAVLALAGKQAAAIGIDLEELGVTDELSAEDAAALAAGATTVNQQNNLPLAKKRVDIAQQNADSQRISATRPRAESRPPQPTAVSEAAPLLAKVERGEKLTAGQEEKLKRLGMSPTRGMSESERRRAARAARSGTAPTPVKAGTPKYRFDPKTGKLVKQ